MNKHSSPPDVDRIAWAETASELRTLADFFAGEAVRSDDYISAGEIQYGLSPDGDDWAPDVAARFQAEFAAVLAPGSRRRVCAAWDAAGQPVAVAAIAREGDGEPTYVVLEDLLVASRMRDRKIGEALLAFVERECRAMGALWIFLEVGMRNPRAAEFYGRHGYGALAQVFGKRLDGTRSSPSEIKGC